MTLSPKDTTHMDELSDVQTVSDRTLDPSLVYR